VYRIRRAKSCCFKPKLEIRKSRRLASVVFTLLNYKKIPSMGQLPLCRQPEGFRGILCLS
jgi:hypothetical protein